MLFNILSFLSDKLLTEGNTVAAPVSYTHLEYDFSIAEEQMKERLNIA